MALFEHDDDQTNELINRIIKIGEVSSVNTSAGTARVVFDDEDSHVSYDLPVLHRNTFANRDYGMPDIGEDVLCLFLPTGAEEGFIIGSFYAGNVTPPSSSGDVRMVEFSDGTQISYDRSSHELTATIDGTNIKANRETVDVKGTNTVNVESAQNINLKSSAIKMTFGGTTMELNSGNAVIDTTNITFTGDARINGDLYVDGNIKASGSIDENS